MPRIPEHDLQRLKEEVSVQRLVEAAGITLSKGGKNLLGKCVWHDDQNASLIITPHKNLWHCYPCSQGGGPIDWVMKLRGVSFRHAVELLKAELVLRASLPSYCRPNWRRPILARSELLFHIGVIGLGRPSRACIVRRTKLRS